MTFPDDKLAKLEKIYSDMRDVFEAHASHYLTKPEALGGDVGFCILYTPPILNPDLLVIGKNPSFFNPSNEFSEEDELMMSGTIPTVNSYLEHKHLFATELKNMFCYENEKPNILDNTVGMNIWFFQGKDIPQDISGPIGELKKSCEKATKDVIRLFKPKTILAVGVEAMRVCDSDNMAVYECWKEGEKMRGRVFGKTKFENIYPVFMCNHLTGARISTEQQEYSRQKCKEQILLIAEK